MLKRILCRLGLHRWSLYWPEHGTYANHYRCTCGARRDELGDL